MRFLKIFYCSPFSKSDLNCFLSCVYDLRPVEKKSFARIIFLSLMKKKINLDLFKFFCRRFFLMYQTKCFHR